MNIASLALKTFAMKALYFERATKDPMRAQEKVLFEYLSRNKDTEYGRKYNFSAVNSVKDYQTFVPMGDSETMRPYIDRMLDGEAGVLTRDRAVFFGLTSGTTGHPKYIPVTEFSRAKKAEVADLWAYYISRDHPSIADGKILAIISPEVEGITPSGVPYGAESGHGYRNLPRPVKHLYALPYGVFDIKDYNSRYYAILRIGMEQDVRTIATLNPSTIALLCERIMGWQERIFKDIAAGTLDKDFDMDGNVRNAIERRLKANPGRASELEAILKKKGRLLPMDFWPNMRLIECWKGGTVKLYLKELPQYFGDVPVRDFGCLSTEARSSIPMSDHGAGGVLAVETNFYEFVPKEEMDKRKKRFLLADQLEKGKEYVLIVTTPGGLYRYNIDDIVAVDGFFNSTPMIEFVQKGLHAVSVTGEKIYESHVSEAINSAAEQQGLVIKFFAASVEMGRPARYIFLVEFDNEVPRDRKRTLLAAVEKWLCRQNDEYRQLREQALLGAPVLKVVREGEFERYRARKIEEGVHDTQFKVPKLTGDLDFQKNFHIKEEVAL
jgi:hypothetical protein